MIESKPLAGAEQEGLRIVTAAQKNGIQLRLLGGIAIKLRCKSAAHRTLVRAYADIDVVGHSKQRKQISELFHELGYSPREVFNKFTPDRMIFQDLGQERRVDIFLDHMKMCHTLDFKNRLALHATTLPLADLVMTKLQVVEATEREVKDLIALLNDHPLGETDEGEVINGRYIAQVCADDWGIHKTFTLSLENLRQFLPTYLHSDEDANRVRESLDKLDRMIAEAPKTSRWKLRAMVGEKKRWYELPEADRKIVESRFAAGKGAESQTQK